MGSVVVFAIVILAIIGAFYFIYDYSKKKNNAYKLLTKGTRFSCPNTCYCPPKEEDKKAKGAERAALEALSNTDCAACKDLDSNFCFNCDLIEGGLAAGSLEECQQACDTTYQCNAFRYNAAKKHCRLLYHDVAKLPGVTVSGERDEQFGWKLRPTSEDGSSVRAAPLFAGESYSQKCMDRQ